MKNYQIGQTKEFEASQFGQYINMVITNIHTTKSGMIRLTYKGQYKSSDGSIQDVPKYTGGLFKP